MQKSAFILIFLLCLSFIGCSNNSDQTNLSFNSVSELKEAFQWTDDRATVISAHRGGSYPAYPENCVETFEYILDSTTAMLEIDVSMTKDSVLILMHDYTLNRTSTGTGKVSDKTYAECQSFFLEDLNGVKTPFRIPTFKQALEWAKGKTVLNVDIKRGVPFSMIMDEISGADALGSVFIIVYNLDDARKFLKLEPDVMLSVSLRSFDEIRRAHEAHIPFDQIYAFTGTRLNEPALYDSLHRLGIFCNLGTLGNLDRMAAAKGDSLYSHWVKMGIDILATDRPLEAAAELAK